MSDDQVGCEWVRVSSGTGLPGLSGQKLLNGCVCVCVCVRACVCACVCVVMFMPLDCLLINCVKINIV